jgi:hypothetical protein
MLENPKKILLRRELKTLLLLWGLIFLLSIALVGCKKDPKAAFIQGTWYYKNAHLANLPGESAQTTTWEFDNGYFSVASCCFTKAYFSGYYSITDRKEDKLFLELYQLKGQNGEIVLHKDDTLDLEISVDIDADSLKINSSGPFTRLSP